MEHSILIFEDNMFQFLDIFLVLFFWPQNCCAHVLSGRVEKYENKTCWFVFHTDSDPTLVFALYSENVMKKYIVTRPIYCGWNKMWTSSSLLIPQLLKWSFPTATAASTTAARLRRGKLLWHHLILQATLSWGKITNYL